MKSLYTILVEKSEEKRPHGKSRPRWKDNIKMDHQEMGWGHGLDWSGSGYGQVVSTFKCGNEHPGFIKCR
jgi:hypothetical protein